MSLYGFGGDGTKHKTTVVPISSKLNRILILGVAIGMAILSFFVIIPEDMFTTALFFDSLHLTPVYEGTSFLFGNSAGIWANYPQITASSGAFTLALMLARLYMGYKAAMESKWSDDGGFRIIAGKWFKGDPIRNLNTIKVSYTLAYWGLDIFDTVTDAVYRQGDYAYFVTALVVSWLFYSLFSEWMFIQGTKTAVTELLLLFSDTPVAKGSSTTQSQQQPRNRNQGNQGGRNDNRNRNEPRHDRDNNGRPPLVPDFSDLPDLRRRD